MLSIDLQNELKLLEHFNLLLLIVLLLNYVGLTSQALLLSILSVFFATPMLLVLFPALLTTIRMRGVYSIHLIFIVLVVYATYYSKFSILSTTGDSSYLVNNTVLALTMPLVEAVNNFNVMGCYAYITTNSSLALNTSETKAFILANFNFYTLQAYYTNLSDIIVNSLTYDYYNILPVILTTVVVGLGLSYLNYYIISF